MRIARLAGPEGETYGIAEGARVATREDIVAETGVPLPRGVRDFLFGGWLGEVGRAAARMDKPRPLSGYGLLAPIPDPPKIMCMAFNYDDHARELSEEPPDGPVIVMKPRTALCGSGADIVLADPVRQLDYEAELAVVVGRRVKGATAAEARDAVFGYMVMNDVSARDVQFRDRQFTRGKGYDTFAPCGPWVTTADEAGDPGDMRVSAAVNGETRQDSSTRMMRTKPAEAVRLLSEGMTLEPGDIISTGTPGGSAHGRGAGYLAGGDLVEVEVGGLGRVSNTVRDVRGLTVYEKVPPWKPRGKAGRPR